MKTTLPALIATPEQAMAFIQELHANGELWHFEDDACQLDGDPFTQEEGERLNELAAQMMGLPYFDPFEIALEIVRKTKITHTDAETIAEGFKNPNGMLITDTPEIRKTVAEYAKGIIRKLHEAKRINQ
jgi:hypothetical protein